MKIVVAPDSFKESLSARAAAEAIARGIRGARPDAQIELIPIADGGEGTVEALVTATGGAFHETDVTGPRSERVTARWGSLGDGHGAIIEMAAASGLALVPSAARNPLHTTTFGTGELIRAALDAGAERIIIGIGGSATNDGGAGAAQALGVRFLDSAGHAIEEHLGGGALARVARIDASGLNPSVRRTRIEVACDVTNPLCGPRGAAAVYGPQKGATPEQVGVLDRNLEHMADLIQRDLGIDVRDRPGAGAAGGLGAGLVAFLSAELRRGIELILEAVHFHQRIAGADLIITGEGRLDAQSMMGKVIAGVGAAARAAGVPVVALVGSTGDGADAALSVLERYQVVSPPDLDRADALRRAPELLRAAAAELVRARTT